MLCMTEERDPRKCLHEGRAVSDCAFEFFGLLKANCPRQFEEYAECVDHAALFNLKQYALAPGTHSFKLLFLPIPGLSCPHNL